MSTPVMPGLDARGALIGWTKGLLSMYVADIRATPEADWTRTFGGCTRSGAQVTADALGLLVWITAALKGDVRSDYGRDMADVAAELADREVAVSRLTEAVDAYCSALAQASDDALNANVTPPWQMPAPLFILAHIATSHLWYHDGQLNYIQCLLGDDKVHWMGD